MKQNITIEQCKLDLINAAKRGQMPQVKTAIKRASKLLDGSEARLAEFINSEDSNHIDAFTTACSGKHIEIVKFLLTYININEQHSGGRTRLMQVIATGNIELAKLLASANNADINIRDDAGKTACIWAAWKGQTEILGFLLKKQPDIDQIDHLNYATLLAWAVYGGDKNTIEFLIQNKANINAQDKNGYTPLRIATNKAYTEIVKLLLKYGADTEIVSLRGTAVLQAAASRAHTEIVKLLIEYGANLDVVDIEGNTILHTLYLYGARKLRFDDKGMAEITFQIINKNKNNDILKLNKMKQSPLDLVITYQKNNFVKTAIKSFLFHKDFSKYFMRLKGLLKLSIKDHFGISETQNDEETIDKMKESVIKELGIADLAQAVLNHLHSEASEGNFASETPSVNYFFKHHKEWVDFVLFHQKLDNLRLQNKPEEATFTETIIVHLNLKKVDLVKIIGGIALVNILKKSKLALSKVYDPSSTKLPIISKTLPETLRCEIGQFLSLEDIKRMYADYITDKKQQILKLKEQQQIAISQLAIKAHEEETILVKDVINQKAEQSIVIGENGYIADVEI